MTTKLQKEIAKVLSNSSEALSANRIAHETNAEYKAVYSSITKLVETNLVEKMDDRTYLLTDLGVIEFGLSTKVMENTRAIKAKPKYKAPDEIKSVKRPLVQPEEPVQKTPENVHVDDVIDEVEVKPYPFVTDSIIEDTETRATHHIPINEKTASEIKHHVNGSTPDYYKGKSGSELFDFFEDFMTPEALNGAYVFNVIKYVTRFKVKNGRNDLLKARDYLDKLIEAY